MSKSWRKKRDWRDDDFEAPKRKDWFDEEQRQRKRKQKYDWFDHSEDDPNYK